MLATPLGGDIDGAWWPHVGSVAAELPWLVEALHRPLGEILDINVNWSTTDPSPDLNALIYGAMLSPNCRSKPQRLMMVTGARGRARLLVVPFMTSAALGLMVLRRAAHLSIPTGQETSKVYQIADFVVRTAEVESATWATRDGVPTAP
jgi:Family of unknown function (DUF5994)